MPITVACGQCRHTMRVAEEHAGKKVRCKGCGQAVPVPAALEELDDLPEPPAKSLPLPPPLPSAKPKPAPGKPTAGVMDQAQAWLKDAQTKAPWLKDRRVQIGLASVAGLFFLIIVISFFSGGKTSTDKSDSGSGSGNGSASADGGSSGGGSEKQKEEPKPKPPPEAGEAAGVLPPPPPPFKHAALAKRAESGNAKDRNAAIEQLGQKGAEAKPAARALCEAILDKETRESALLALEKVHPVLFPHVRTLVVDNNAWNHQQASQAIANLHEEGSAAVPVLLGHISYVAFKVDAKHPFHNSIEQMVGEDLTTLSLIAPGEANTAKLLIGMVGYKLPSGKPGITVRQRAIDGLGRIAFQFPASRPAIVLTIIPALVDADLQKNALAASALCSTESAPLKPVLQKLKLHPDANVRKAADDALAEIELRVTYVPQMNKAGLVEGLVPHPLFEWAYGIVSGKTPPGTPVPDLAKHDKAELYMLYTSLCLSRLPDSPDRPQTEVRKMALEKAIPFAEKQANLRKYIAPVLIEAMNDPANYALARDGLFHCGADGVRLLKASKTEGAKQMFAELDALLRARWDKVKPEEQGTLLQMFAELDSLSTETGKLLLAVLRSSHQQGQAVQNGRLAAKMFVRFGITDLSIPAELFGAMKNKYITDAETLQLLRQACTAAKINLENETSLHGSMVQHPEASPEVRQPSAEWLWKNYPKVSSSLDDHMKKAFREALTAMALGEIRDDGKNPRRMYAIYERRDMALFLVNEFGTEAKGVAPLFVQWLTRLATSYAREDSRRHAEAVIALEKFGPDTEQAKETLALLLSAELSRHIGAAEIKSTRNQCKRILVKWQAVPPSQETPVEPPPGAVVLFNGGNLDAVWDAHYRQKPAQMPWQVDAARKVLVNKEGRNQHGTIFTKKEYRNFTLHVEFRFPDPVKLASSGGGVVVRCKGLEANQLYPGGIESEVDIHDCGDVKSLVGGVTLKGKDVIPNHRLVRKWKNWECAEGGWNVMELTCQGDKMTVKLNGEIVNEVEGMPDRPGPIALIDNGGLIEYRNIFVVPLDR
jgi:hypothetical protein